MSLSDAILEGRFKDVQLLLGQGADVNEQDPYGYTPLIESIIVDNFEMLRYLVKAGADVNAEDITGATALQWACDFSQLPMAEILLEKGADPNHYTADGLPILVYPLLRKQTALVELLLKKGASLELAQDYIETKLLAHRFELRGSAELVNTRGEFFEIDIEGFFLEFTLGLITDSLKQYLEKNNQNEFPSLSVLSQKIARSLDNASQLMQRKYARRKQNEILKITDLIKIDLLVLPISYQGHAITFVKYGNLFAKCDRGVNKITDTVVIYQIKKPELWTESFIVELLTENKTEFFIHTELKSILQLKPIVTLPSRYQITGNCSWANVEASVPASLFMLLYASTQQNPHGVQALKKQIMKFYSHWVEWERDRALEKFIADFNQISKPRQAARVALLAALVLQRGTQLKTLDIARTKKIMPVLVLPEYAYVLDSYIKVYAHPQAGKLGKNFLKLLQAVGVDPKAILKNSSSTSTNAKPAKMHYPLHLAALAGDLARVMDLIEKFKVDVNWQDQSGNTALMFSAWKGHLPVLEYLLKKGADPKIKNKKGGMAKHYAIIGGHKELMGLL
ncbi:MAG: ankyrin repeat domain-containing protein [Gammaproteobacteria bacterium]